MDITIIAMYGGEKTETLEKRINSHNIDAILDEIDGFISKNKEMDACGVLISSDVFNMVTVVCVCKKFDIFDLYSFIETQIYHYIY